MSPELIAIITMGIGLGALWVGGVAFLYVVQERAYRSNQMALMEQRLYARDATIRALTAQVKDLERQVTYMSGLLAGLRESISRQSRQI